MNSSQLEMVEEKKRVGYYGEKYHILRHRKYITKDRYFSFSSKVAEEKFWSFFEGKTAEVWCGIGQNIYGHKETVELTSQSSP